MGKLVNGEWTTEWYGSDEKGRFIRDDTVFHGRVTADGKSGFPAEAGRYHLYVSWACPWAHRSLIARELKGLSEAITVSYVDHFLGEDGWFFSENPGATPDHVLGKSYLRDVYREADPQYTGRVTVPVLWDRKKHTIVNNESREILEMLDLEFGELAEESAPRLYPSDLREAVDREIDANYGSLNNGVYRCGFAKSQQAYEEAVRELFDALDRCEATLAQQRYLVGDRLTAADVCLFTTLIRFDLVYHGHFKCNLHRIVEYPNLWNYVKEIFQIPAVRRTVNFEHIKKHYYQSHESINPTRIYPLGPVINFDEAHDRERFNT